MIAHAISFALVLASALVSFAVLWRASLLLRRAAHSSSPPAVSETAIDVLQKKLDALEAEVREIRGRPISAPVPHAPRAGMNLDRRSQALRMHRRGESPAQIAAALDLPLQEVDLLLKVHRIVLRTI
jgi:hypothetical protein